MKLAIYIEVGTHKKYFLLQKYGEKINDFCFHNFQKLGQVGARVPYKTNKLRYPEQSQVSTEEEENCNIFFIISTILLALYFCFNYIFF